MFSFKRLKDRLIQAWTHHSGMRKLSPLAQQFLDLAAWSIMVENPVLAECLDVPKAVGGFAAYDALLSLPVSEVAPDTISGLYAFVMRASHDLPASQRAELTGHFQSLGKLLMQSRPQKSSNLRLVHGGKA